MALARGGLVLANRIQATDIDVADDVTVGDDLTVTDDIQCEDLTVTDDLVAANGYIGGATTSGHHADADEFAVGAAATVNAGITIESTGLAVIAARDAGDNDAGRFQYDHSGTPQWEVWVEGGQTYDFAAAQFLSRATTHRQYVSGAAYILGHDAGTSGSTSLTLHKDTGGTAEIRLRSDEGGAFQTRGLVSCDASENLILQHNNTSATKDAGITLSAALATVDSDTVLLTSGGLRTGYRDLAANAALTLAASDAGGTVVVRSTDTSTVAATMTALGAGSRIRVILVERTSTGSYTLAATYGTTAGTVTLNAQHEGVDLVYTGSIWRAELLLGGAGFA